MEQHVFLAEGLSKSKEIITNVAEASLHLFFSKGDTYVYDDEGIKGVLVGIYINWIAVDKESKGTGVFRKLIIPIMEICEKKNMDNWEMLQYLKSYRKF